MSETQNFQVIVKSVKRIASGSVNGNPRYALHTDRGIFKTKVDAQCGYTVTNDFSEIGEYAIPAVLHCTKSGYVIDWTLTD